MRPDCTKSMVITYPAGWPAGFLGNLAMLCRATELPTLTRVQFRDRKKSGRVPCNDAWASCSTYKLGILDCRPDPAPRPDGSLGGFVQPLRLRFIECHFARGALLRDCAPLYLVQALLHKGWGKHNEDVSFGGVAPARVRLRCHCPCYLSIAGKVSVLNRCFGTCFFRF